MIEVKTFVCNPLQENAYVVSDDTGEAVVIDCGAFYEEERKAIVDYVNRHHLKLKHLLCTHGHFDHIFGCDTIYENFGLKPEIFQEDVALANDLNGQIHSMLGARLNLQMPPIGHCLSTDEIIDFGTHQFRTIHTPGHTPGGGVFYCEEEHTLFSGDTLFRMSIGRTDFPGGSYEQMIRSLNILAQLPAETVVYTGHGPATKIGEEVRMNPYFR